MPRFPNRSRSRCGALHQRGAAAVARARVVAWALAGVWAGIGGSVAVLASDGVKPVQGEAAPGDPLMALARAAAAQQADMLRGLLQEIERPSVMALVARGLEADEPRGARAVLASALAGAGAPVRSELAAPLGLGLRAVRDDPAQQPTALSLLAALARLQSREAVRAVIEGVLADESNAPELLRRAAFATLVDQTGQAHFGEDLGAWRTWWNDAQSLSEMEWRGELLKWQARAARQGRREATAASDALADAYRRLYAFSPEEARAELVGQMLLSPNRSLRLAGLDLIVLTLANAKPVAESVASAAAGRLSDPDAGVRARAASVVELLDRDADRAALSGALQREQDAVAAAAIFRAAAKRPAPGDVLEAQRWIDHPGDAGNAAVDYLLAAKAAGLTMDEQVERTLDRALDERDPRLLSPAAFRALVTSGRTQRVLELTHHQDPRVVNLALETLASAPDALPLLLKIAQGEPALFETAIEALARHRATSRGILEGVTLPAPSDEVRSRGIMKLLRSAPPSELLIALEQSQPGADNVARFLGPLMTPQFLTAGPDLPERVELTLRVADAYLQTRQFAEALAVLERLPADLLGPRSLALRLTSLLCLSRFQDADQLMLPLGPSIAAPLSDEATTQSWLRAIELTEDRGLALTLRRGLISRYGATMDARSLERLARVTQGLYPQGTPVGPP